MSSRSWWGDLTAAIDGTFAPVVKSVLAETCAARLRAALIQGVLALTYARNWVLLHTGMESSLLHIVNFDVGFSGISPVLFVCGPGMKKSVKDVCQRVDVFCFQRSLTGWDCGSICSCFSVVLHVLDLLPGRKPCGSSMESLCVCVHLLFRRCLRVDVCLRPDRKHCGCSCVWERLQPGCKPCSSSMVCWCVCVHLLCRRCLRPRVCLSVMVSGLLWLVPGLYAKSAAVSNESSSTLDRIQAMLISLTGKTFMIDAILDAPVLFLVEYVAKLLGLPETCFYLTVGSRVLRDCMSLAAEGVGFGLNDSSLCWSAGRDATGQWRFSWRWLWRWR